MPRICFVNKMDRLGADFYNCEKMIISNLGAKPLALQLPIGSEDQFKGVIDLVRMKAVVWNGEELGAKFEDQEIPADLQARAEEYRNKLIDAIVEQDDAVLEKYFEVGPRMAWRGLLASRTHACTRMLTGGEGCMATRHARCVCGEPRAGGSGGMHTAAGSCAGEGWMPPRQHASGRSALPGAHRRAAV